MKMRRVRRKNMGKVRKRLIRAKGTTPAFAIHPEGKKPAATEAKSAN